MNDKQEREKARREAAISLYRDRCVAVAFCAAGNYAGQKSAIKELNAAAKVMRRELGDAAEEMMNVISRDELRRSRSNGRDT